MDASEEGDEGGGADSNNRGKIYVIQLPDRYAIVVEAGEISRSASITNPVDVALKNQIETELANSANVLKAIKFDTGMDASGLMKSFKHYLASK